MVATFRRTHLLMLY